MGLYFWRDVHPYPGVYSVVFGDLRSLINGVGGGLASGDSACGEGEAEGGEGEHVGDRKLHGGRGGTTRLEQG